MIERRALRWLLFLYCVFILYGTFMPFRFSADPLFVRSQWQRFFMPPFVNGVRQFSILDVLSNILLFIPFGFLWIGSEIGKSFFGRILGAVFGVGLVGGLFGLGIEYGQVYSPGRTASILDALCNGSGAALGGFFGYVIFSGRRGALGAVLISTIRQGPALPLLALLTIVPLADAYYPFQLTLDVSTAWHNLKHTQWIPFAGGFQGFWLDLVVDKAVVVAAIGFLVVVSLRQSHKRLGSGFALVFCLALGFFVEAGKLLFVGRIPNVENLVLFTIGSLFGVLIVAPLGRTPFCRRHALAILLILEFTIMVYAELSPFDWIESAAELPLRWAKIEWLPLGAYYRADQQSALFDLGKKLFIAGPLGLLLAARKQHRSIGSARALALLAGLTSGSLLESVQIALRSRTPSVTDILLFGAASWAGALVFERWAKLRDSKNSSSS